jgi:hypothetical protein
VETLERSRVNEEQADRASAEDDGGLPGAGVGLFQTAYYAGQGLSERGVLKRHRFGNPQGVLLDNARGDTDEFGVCTVVEEQIVAKILLVIAAEEAVVAGRGVEWNNPIADGEGSDAVSNLLDGSSELMPEEPVWGEHLRVIASAVDLEIGAAGKGGADAQHQFAASSHRHRHVFNTEVFLAAKNGGSHPPANGLVCGLGHLNIFSSRGSMNEIT